MIKAKDYIEIAKLYAEDVASGNKIAGREIILAGKRFLSDLERDDIELRPRDPNIVCSIMEGS